jgi:hypothetical protein
MLRRSLALVLVAGCGAAPPPGPAVVASAPAPIDAGVVDAAAPDATPGAPAPIDATIDAAPYATTDVTTGATALAIGDAGVDAAPPVILPAPPPVSGRVTRLAPGQARGVGRGVTVRWTEDRHKHKVDGGATAIVGLAVKRGGRSKTVVVTGDDGIEAELDGFGVIVSVSGGADELEVRTLGAARRALDEDAAAALVEREAARHELPTGGASYSSEGGILHYTSMQDGAPLWEARVGLYSRRVWFVYPSRPSRPSSP